MLARKLQLHTPRDYSISLPTGLTILPSPALVPDCQVGAGEGRHVCNRSQNGAGGGAGPKRPVSLAWRKKRLVGRWTHPKYVKVEKFMGHFERASDPCPIPANRTPGE